MRHSLLLQKNAGTKLNDFFQKLAG